MAISQLQVKLSQLTCPNDQLVTIMLHMQQVDYSAHQ